MLKKWPHVLLHEAIIIALCPGAWPGAEDTELSETRDTQEVELITRVSGSSDEPSLVTEKRNVLITENTFSVLITRLETSGDKSWLCRDDSTLSQTHQLKLDKATDGFCLHPLHYKATYALNIKVLSPNAN